jgi:flagellar FliL protein
MATEAAAPPQKKKGSKLVWLVLAVIALGGGAALPWVFATHKAAGHNVKKADTAKAKQTALPFSDVVVNLPEDRLSRFLRAKIMVAVEETDAKEMTELLESQKAFLKSWLIGYLSDQSTQEVTRKVGVNRIRREIRDQFNAMLFPDGEEKVVEILFDEFVVQ